jgi:hypothetical protein
MFYDLFKLLAVAVIHICTALASFQNIFVKLYSFTGVGWADHVSVRKKRRKRERVRGGGIVLG